MLIFFFVACNEEEEIQTWIQKMDTLRSEAQKESTQTPYGQPQYEAFKKYFSELNQRVLTLKNDEKLQKPFNSVVEKSNLQDDLCPKIFLTKNEWQTIMHNCTRNRFFLCSEEVRSYSDMVSSLRNQLTSQNQNRFDTASSCKDAL